MQFVISLLINPAVLDALTDAEKAAIGDGHGKFLEELRASGELITTQALVDPSQASVVSVRNGQPVVTDGPFLEAKEYLGGFYLIDCENQERAIELAAKIPDSAIEGDFRRRVILNSSSRESSSCSRFLRLDSTTSSTARMFCSTVRPRKIEASCGK